MEMFTETQFPETDLAQLLPRAAFYEIAWMLRRSLPGPVSDDPVELERRDQAAMAAVASLLPVTVAEGRLAAQFALADAWAREWQAMAAERRLEPGLMRQWTAQAVSLMRESKSALRELRQLQTARRKRDADGEAANRAEWEERSAVGMMRGALGETVSRDAISETDLGLGEDEDNAAAGGDLEHPLTLPSPPIAGGEEKMAGTDAGLGALRPAGPGQSPGLAYAGMRTGSELMPRSRLE